MLARKAANAPTKLGRQRSRHYKQTNKTKQKTLYQPHFALFFLTSINVSQINFKFTAIVNNFRSARRLNSEWLPAMPTRPRVCTVYKDDFFPSRKIPIKYPWFMPKKTNDCSSSQTLRVFLPQQSYHFHLYFPQEF